MTHHLHIETHGICTHFTAGVVRGVPHRIVLPNATHIQTETISIAGQGPVLYYLVPHFPHIEVVGGPELSVPGLIWRGYIGGARLQILNCITMELDNQAVDAPGLLTYDPSYTYSEDVVLHGRAACYFDIYGGTVLYHPPLRTNGAGFMSITMETDGPPRLLVTPLAHFPALHQEGAAHVVQLGDSKDEHVRLRVRNVELLSELRTDELRGSFDFLLHYLTARGGIPAGIVIPTPGMPFDPPQVSAEQTAEALVELAKLVAKASVARTTGGTLDLMPEDDLTSSCAPSQYP